MKNRLLAKRIRFHLELGRKLKRIPNAVISVVSLLCGFIFVAILFILALDAFSFDYSEIIKPNDIDKQICEDVSNSFKKFQEADIEAASVSSRQFKNPQDVSVSSDDQGKTIINSSSSPNALTPVEDNDSSEIRKLYYFFSFSIPQRELKQAILDAVNYRSKNADVVLVIRGLVNNDFKSTMNSFRDFKETTGLFDSDFPIEIHPELFKEYSIDKVPTIVYESDVAIGKISGVSISYASSKFSEEIKDYGKYGNTYPIEEDDLMDLLQTRLKLPKYKNKIRNMLLESKKDMYKLNKYNGMFNKAEEDKTFYINPELTLQEDIVDHEGNVLFTEGSTFNPTDYISLTGKYIFIDGNDENQILYALEGNYTKIILTSGNILDLSKKYQHRFFFINDTLIERFQIEKVPTILEQEGRFLRVSEKVID